MHAVVVVDVVVVVAVAVVAVVVDHRMRTLVRPRR